MPFSFQNLHVPDFPSPQQNSLQFLSQISFGYSNPLSPIGIEVQWLQLSQVVFMGVFYCVFVCFNSLDYNKINAICQYEILAPGEGFEPSGRFDTPSGLANRPRQPLEYPSIIFGGRCRSRSCMGLVTTCCFRGSRFCQFSQPSINSLALLDSNQCKKNQNLL